MNSDCVHFKDEDNRKREEVLMNEDGDDRDADEPCSPLLQSTFAPLTGVAVVTTAFFLTPCEESHRISLNESSDVRAAPGTATS